MSRPYSDEAGTTRARPAAAASSSSGDGALPDRRDLIDGINAAFLSARAILPIGLDGERLVCAMATPDDHSAMAALAFASGRAVSSIPATRAAILAALGGMDHAPTLVQVRFGDDVVRLRAYLVRAVSIGADHVRIGSARDPGIAICRDGRDLEREALTPREVAALIAAADALVNAEHVGRRDAGIAVTVAGRRHRLTIDAANGGRRLTIQSYEA